MRYRPHDLLTPEHLAIPIAQDKPVVLYDEHGGGDLTRQIADKLAGNGFADVRILDGGFAAWEQADGPTQEAGLEQVVPPMRGVGSSRNSTAGSEPRDGRPGQRRRRCTDSPVIDTVTGTSV